MALDLNDKARPYFPQLNLDEVFGDIQSAVNVLEAKSSPAKVWRGIFTQTGTSAPVVTVLESQLTGDIVWTRTTPLGGKVYTGTLAGQFNAGRTFINGQSTFLGSTTKVDTFTDLNGFFAYVYIDVLNDNSFSINLKNAAGVDLEWSASVGTTPYLLEILVYQD